jgi:uncharacterized Zn-finger protein
MDDLLLANKEKECPCCKHFTLEKHQINETFDYDLKCSYCKAEFMYGE